MRRRAHGRGDVRAGPAGLRALIAMRAPEPPIELRGHADRLTGGAVAMAGTVLERLAAAAPTTTDEEQTAQASRDWWPLAMHWALAGQVPRRAAAVCRPT